MPVGGIFQGLPVDPSRGSSRGFPRGPPWDCLRPDPARPLRVSPRYPQRSPLGSMGWDPLFLRKPSIIR